MIILQKPSSANKVDIVNAYPIINNFGCWLHFAFIALGILLALCYSETAVGQTYEIGKKKYMSGDFSGAETALIKASEKPHAAAEMANIYKLLGINQHMQDKKKPATTSFIKALDYNPQTIVYTGEVLDDAIIPFFNNIKKQYTPKHPTTVKPTIATAPKNLAATTAPIKKVFQGKASTSKGRAADTASSNGKMGKNTIIHVSTNGPRATVVIDDIIAGTTGANLDVDPGVKILKVIAKGYADKVIKIRAHAGRKNLYTVEMEKKVSKIATSKRAKNNATAKANKVKDEAAEMFAEKEPKYTDDTAETKRPDSGYGNTHPAAGAGTYHRASAGMAQPFAQPFVIPQTRGTVTLLPTNGSVSNLARLGPPPIASSDENVSPVKRARAVSVAVAMLPFGIGQFQNNDRLFGFVFMAAQTAALANWYVSEESANNATEESNKYRAEVPRAYWNEGLLNENDRASNTKWKESQISLAAFFTFWAIGSAEAYFSLPYQEGAKSSASLSGIDAPSSDRSVDSDERLMARPSTESNWRLAVGINQNKTNGYYSPILQLHKEF